MKVKSKRRKVSYERNTNLVVSSEIYDGIISFTLKICESAANFGENSQFAQTSVNADAIKFIEKR